MRHSKPIATVGSWPGSVRSCGTPASPASDLGLLGDLESVVDLDAEVSHRAFQLRVPRAEAELLSDFSFAGRSASASYVAWNAFRSRPDQGRSLGPSGPQYEHTAVPRCGDACNRLGNKIVGP